MDHSILLVTIVIGISHFTNGQFQCPKKTGQFEDPVQCDKFYDCKDGVATTKLCPDGLVFDPLNRKINKCDQPFSVDCGDRTELQNPQSNNLCPRRNGYFAHPDEKVCNIFYNCIEGDGTEIVCPNGLHFDEYAGTCAWPDTAGRSGCADPDELKLKDGFMCPKDKPYNSRGQTLPIQCTRTPMTVKSSTCVLTALRQENRAVLPERCSTNSLRNVINLKTYPDVRIGTKTIYKYRIKTKKPNRL